MLESLWHRERQEICCGFDRGFNTDGDFCAGLLNCVKVMCTCWIRAHMIYCTNPNIFGMDILKSENPSPISSKACLFGLVKAWVCSHCVFHLTTVCFLLQCLPLAPLSLEWVLNHFFFFFFTISNAVHSHNQHPKCN